MKYLLFIVIVLPFLSYGQGYQLLGTKKNTVQVQNGLQIDSFLTIPANGKDSGNIRINSGQLQIKSSGDWMNVGGDTSASLSLKVGNGIRLLSSDSAILGLDISDPNLAGNISDQTYLMDYDAVNSWGRGVMWGFPSVSSTLKPMVITSYGPTKGTGEIVVGSGLGDTSGIIILKGQDTTGKGGKISLNAGGAMVEYQGPGSGAFQIVTASEIQQTTSGSSISQDLYMRSKEGLNSIEYTYTGGTSNGFTYAHRSGSYKDITLTDSTAPHKFYVDNKVLSKLDTGLAVLVNGNNTASALSIGTNTNQAVNIKVNNATVGTFATSGNFSVANNVISNATSSNNSTLVFSGNGLIVGRTIADANTSFTARLSSNSATGKIIAAQFGSGNLEKWSVNYQGTVRMTSAPNTTNAIRSLVWGIDSTIQSMPLDTNVVNSAATLTLSTKGYYTFNGTTSTWTLPALVGNTTVRYIIANMGSGTLTLSAATNTLWESGVVGTNTTIQPGETTIVYNNSLYWTVYN